MKKVILVPALLGAMGIGGVIAATGGNLVGSADSSKVLSVSHIEKKALQEVNGKIKDIELETDDNKKVYEVDIETNDFEYDLKFDAITGELLKKKKDARDDDRYDDDRDDLEKQSTHIHSTNEQQAKNEVVTSQSNNHKAVVTQEPQKEVVKATQAQAQAQAPTPAPTTKPATTNNAPRQLSVNEIKTKALAIVQGKIVEIELETDDNRRYYEIEIITNNAEYKLKLDAFTGALLEKEVDDLDDDDFDDDHFDD